MIFLTDSLAESYRIALVSGVPLGALLGLVTVVLRKGRG